MQDPSESIAVVGRYISENYNGIALHPIDFFNISTGQLIAEVMDPNITTISPVNKLHPQYDVLASGSSRYSNLTRRLLCQAILFSLKLIHSCLIRSIFIWKPEKDQSESIEQRVKKNILVCGKAEKKRKSKGDSDESDDDIYKAKKNIKSMKTKTKSNSVVIKGKQ